MAAAPLSRYRFVIWWLVLWEQSSIGFNFLAPASMLPLIMDEFQIDRTTAGTLMSAAPLMMVATTVPGSLMAARLGFKLTYGLGAFLMGAGILAPFTSDFTMLLVLRVIFGIGGALVSPQSPAIVARWFPSRQLPLINGITTLTQNVAVTITVAGGAVLAQTVGWRLALAIFAAIPLTCSLVWWIIGKESPPGTETSAVTPRIGDMLGMLRRRNTLLLGVLLFGQWGQNVALNSWLPVYYNRVMGFPLSTAGFMVSIMPLFGIIGATLGGFLPVKLGLRRPFFIGPGCVLVLAAFTSFLSRDEALILASIAVLGIFSRLYLPSAMTLPMELPGLNTKQAGVTLAAAYTVGNFGSFFGPFMVGFLSDQTSSYVPGLSLVALLSLCMVGCGYLLPETGPKATRVRPRLETAE